MAKSAKRQRESNDDAEDFSDLENDSSLEEVESQDGDGDESFDDEDVNRDEEEDDDDDDDEPESDENEEEEEDERPEEEVWGKGRASTKEDMSEDDDEGNDDDEDEDSVDEQNEIQRDAEMADLEKEYMDLKNQEQDMLKNLKRHKDEDVLKGQAVKNQKVLWDKTLEFRFLLQKAFQSSNRLPQEPIRSSFCDLDEAVSKAYSDLIDSSKKTLDALEGLQEALLEKNPSVAQSSSGNSRKPSKNGLENSSTLDEEGDKEWCRISQLHTSLASFRDKSIDKWQRKTQVTTGAAAIKGKLQAFNQNVSEQVSSYMRDPSRMIKQMQQRKSTIEVFGDVSKNYGEVDGDDKPQEVQADGDPELLDDSEFYQQLLREFLETIDPNVSETTLYAFKRFQVKKRKVVDRRASKSRKIRYNVHEKMVNFCARQHEGAPDMASKLFENLFGVRS